MTVPICFFPNLAACEIGSNCTSNSDCAGGGSTACAADISLNPVVTTCLNVEEAQTWIDITYVAMLIVGIILTSHVVLTYFYKLKASRAARLRRLSKAKKSRKVEDDAFENLAEDDDDVEASTSGLKLLDKFSEEVEGYLTKSQDIITRIRTEQAIVKVSSHVLTKKSIETATMVRVLCLAFLKRGALNVVDDTEAQKIVDVMDDCISNLERSTRDDNVDRAERKLDQVKKMVTEKARLLGKDGKNPIQFNINWDLYEQDYQNFQSKVYKELHPNDEYHTMTALLLTRGVTSAEGDDLVQQARRKRGVKDTIKGCLKTYIPIPGFIKQFPIFYACFFGGAIVIFLSWVTKDFQSNLDMQQRGGLAGTYLPVPNYYDVNDGNPQMKQMIPYIYGVMHMALYFLCWIPVPMTRGFLRDISSVFPEARNGFPIDDVIFFHKLVGMLLLACLLTGGCIFAAVVGGQCLSRKEDDISNQCFAFDPIPPAAIKPNQFSINPVQNVYMLRKIVTCTWFTIFPLLHWGNSPPRWAPRTIQKYWYEICFYGHHFVAHLSVVLALTARFEVFYPTLGTWSLYYIDKIREMTTKTKKTEIVIRPVFAGGDENPDDSHSTTIHLDAADKPTSMRLLIEVPPNFKVNAGQWIYLKVPSISAVEWHPFSLASAARDDFVELHVGIRGDKKNWIKQKDADDPWEMRLGTKTWSYDLYRAIRKRIIKVAAVEDPERQSEAVMPLNCEIRGPYGSTFTKCFDPHYYGSIVIGAGTGLTAAESVLRELFWRKRQKARIPKYTWFIWSCQRVDDLLWAWQSLHDLLLEAACDGTLRPGKKWNESSLMLDWLGIYFYVSRADKDSLERFVKSGVVDEEDAEQDEIEVEVEDQRDDMVPTAEPVDVEANAHSKSTKTMERQKAKEATTLVRSAKATEREHLSGVIQKWMANRRRLFTGSMDDPDCHIEKVFAWSRLFVDRKAGKHKKIALCFCGPPGLAHTLHRASKKVGNNGDGMQFSADHQ